MSMTPEWSKNIIRTSPLQRQSQEGTGISHSCSASPWLCKASQEWVCGQWLFGKDLLTVMLTSKHIGCHVSCFMQILKSLPFPQYNFDTVSPPAFSQQWCIGDSHLLDFSLLYWWAFYSLSWLRRNSFGKHSQVVLDSNACEEIDTPFTCCLWGPGGGKEVISGELIQALAIHRHLSSDRPEYSLSMWLNICLQHLVHIHIYTHIYSMWI